MCAVLRVPVGVTRLTVTAIGAAGGSSDCYTGGGRGATITARVPVTAGEVLAIGVGGPGGRCHIQSGAGGAGGVGGGGAGGKSDPAGGAAGGGGATTVSRIGSPIAPPVPLVTAGGGGGAGGVFGGAGGDAGQAGAAGSGNARNRGGGGTGGTAKAGGTGGFGDNAANGFAGAQFTGGAGAVAQCGGGGGGGGYYGGGGGGGASGVGACGAGGGGGGASYSAAGLTVISSTHPTSVPAAVVITYTLPGSGRTPLVGQEQRGSCTVSSHAPRTAATAQRCTVEVLTSSAGVTFSRATASLIRRGHVVARGTAQRLTGGRLRLVLHSPSPPDAGAYTLRLTPRHGRTLTIAFRLT